MPEGGIEPGTVLGGEKLLGGAEGSGGVGEEGLCEGFDAGGEGFGGDDLRDEAIGVGFFGSEEPGGEEQVAGASFANLEGEVSGNERGDEADFDLGVAELGGGDGEGEVAEGGEAGAAGDGVSVDCCDGGDGEFVEGAEHAGDAQGVVGELGRGFVLHGLQGGEIEAGAEGFSRAGEDEDAGGGGCGYVFERGDELGLHLGGEGVATVGTVESKGADAVRFGNKN